MLKPAPLITFMVDVEDSRKNPNRCGHKLIDILMIALCCIMSNGETWEDMESYGNKKIKWLKTFLVLSNGIPSHDTVHRVFAHLNTVSFQKCFLRWIQSAFPNALQEGEYTDIIPIDGKSIKGSPGKGKSKRTVHMVGAWSHWLGLVGDNYIVQMGTLNSLVTSARPCWKSNQKRISTYRQFVVRLP